MSAKKVTAGLYRGKGPYRSLFIAGAVAFVLIIEYSVTEAITALAWKNPVYSYVHNFISDLGVSGPPVIFEGRHIYSPWYWLMNTGFIIEGILAVTAAFLLRPLLTSKASRITIISLALLHGAGMFMVAIVHGSPGTLHARIGIVHVIGASLAIILGNVECIWAGVAAAKSGAPHWYQWYSIFLGTLGLAGLFFLLGVRSIPPGITERISVNTIICWDVTTGIFLLAGIKSSKL